MQKIGLIELNYCLFPVQVPYIPTHKAPKAIFDFETTQIPKENEESLAEILLKNREFRDDNRYWDGLC